MHADAFIMTLFLLGKIGTWNCLPVVLGQGRAISLKEMRNTTALQNRIHQLKERFLFPHRAPRNSK